MNTTPPNFKLGGPHEHGAALIVTLLVLVLFVVIVTGFLSTTRVEQIAARNYSFQSAAEQMAQLGTQQAIAVLRSNYMAATSGIIFATQPGAITVFDGGSPPSRTLTNFSTGGAVTNLNALTTNSLITGNGSQTVNVGLLNVSNSSGGLLGRYAFFIDDESTKLPVNAADGSRATLNPVFPRPYSVEGRLGFGTATTTRFSTVVSGQVSSSSSISNWSYFFTPEQVRETFGLDSTNLPLISVALETNVAYTTNTPWGSPKVFINSVPFNGSGVDQITSALTNSNLTRIFGQHFGDKYGINNVRQLAANFLQMRSINIVATNNPAVYWPTNGLLGSEELTNPVVALPDSGEFKKTNGIPAAYLGHAPFPMLTDIAVYYAYGWTAPDQMTVRFIIECTLLNPYEIACNLPQAGIYAQIDKAIFPVYYPNDPTQQIESRWRGPFGTQPTTTEFPYNSPVNANDPWGDGGGIYNSLVPPDGVIMTNLGSIPARSSATRYLTFDVRFDESNPQAVADSFFPSYIIIDQIKLLANTNDPASVRDWCSGYDLFNALASSSTGPAQFAIPRAPGAAGNPEGNPLTGVWATLDPVAAPPSPASPKMSRLDPRMRPTLAVATPMKTAPPGGAWQLGAYTSATPSPGLFVGATIPADQAFAANPVNALFDTNLPPYLNLSAAGVPTYFSSADLGKVFTGMPWRRVRLQPQPTNESTAQLIPDWVLLDIFSTASPSVPATAVNPNSTLVSQSGSVTRPAVGLLSQMSVLTNVSRMSQLGNPVFPSDAQVTQLTFSELVATNAARLSTIASNAANPGVSSSWSSGSSWLARRGSLGFPTNVLLLSSELTEVAGVSDYVSPANNVTNKINEQRLGALMPGVQTKSRFFTVYTLGEAFEGTNASAPVVSQRILRTLVRVDTNTSPPSIDIISQITPQN